MAQLGQALSPAAVATYLLIDPMLGDPVLTEALRASSALAELNALRAAAWGRETYALRLPPRLDMDGAFAPYLVELRGLEDPWLGSSLQWAVQETLQMWTSEPDQPVAHRVGGWLQSSAFGASLAERMSGWLQLSAEGAGSACYLRLADRRVLSLLTHVAGEANVGRLLHPVHQWLWLDPQAALRMLQADAVGAGEFDQPQAPSVGHPLLGFSRAQWAQMALGPRVHQAMACSVRQRLSDPAGVAPAQWSAFGPAQWQAALMQAERENKETQEGKHP